MSSKNKTIASIVIPLSIVAILSNSGGLIVSYSLFEPGDSIGWGFRTVCLTALSIAVCSIIGSIFLIKENNIGFKFYWSNLILLMVGICVIIFHHVL